MYNNSLPILYFCFFAEVNGFLLGWLILNVIGWEMVSQYHGDQGVRDSATEYIARDINTLKNDGRSFS